MRLVEVTFDYGKDPDATPAAIEALCHTLERKCFSAPEPSFPPEDVEKASQAGARYIITPNTDEAVIHRTKELDLAALPGAMTPSEVVAAYKAGADIVKIFPCADLGPGYIKALRGPLGFIPMAAVGGVDAHILLLSWQPAPAAPGLEGNWRMLPPFAGGITTP